jgi:peptidoglycan/LPS O-acetylase OafA/YrhL
LSNRRIKSLDSLRGISALIVVVFHCLISFTVFYDANYNNDYPSKPLELFTTSPVHTLWAGNEAVLLFFILSGFVLSLPFLNNRYNGFGEFAIKRFFRIYVPYITLMMASTLLVILFADYNSIEGLSTAFEKRWADDVTPLSIVSYIFMIGYDTTNVNGVVWSLNHEMRISLIFPFLVLFMMKFRWLKALVFALGINAVVVLMLSTVANSIPNEMIGLLIANFRDTFYYLTFFIIGLTLARKRNEVINVFTPFNGVSKLFLFLVSLLLLNNRWLHKYIDFSGTYFTDILAGIGILLIMILTLSSVKADRILSKKPFQFLGDISYSLYMIHIPVMMITTIFLSQFIPIWLTFVLVPIFSIPVAWLSYKYLELPAIAWGRKAIEWKRNKPKVIDSKEIA